MSDLPELQPDHTLLTSVSAESSKLKLRADYFSSPIDLALIENRYEATQVLSTDPLVLSLSKKSHVVVLAFGAIVFWQCDDATCEQFLEEIQEVMTVGPPNGEVRDTLLVLVDQPEERVNFRDIWLKSLTLEHIRTVSESMGRSIALKQCEMSVTEALKKAAPIVHALSVRGALTPSEKDILKTVGFTLSVKETILAKLGLSDDPAHTRLSERLSRLNNLLYHRFDFEKRIVGLNDKVTFLSDLNLMLLTMLQSRTSHRLEWIVILLIIIEVIFSFVHFIGPSK